MTDNSRMPTRAMDQTTHDKETHANHRAEDDPERELMFREIVKTALTYTAHLSRLFVFEGSKGDGKLSATDAEESCQSHFRKAGVDF